MLFRTHKDFPGFQFWSDGTIVSHKGTKLCAKTIKPRYYFKIRIPKGKTVHAHRVIWEAFNGPIPDGMVIDHKNRNINDNSIENLHVVTAAQNQQFRVGKGYYWNKGAKKFQAQITVNGHSEFLGYYNTKDEARAAYLAGKDKYHAKR